MNRSMNDTIDPPSFGSKYQCGFNETELNMDKLGFGQGSILLYRAISAIGIVLNVLFLISSFFQVFGRDQKKRQKISSIEKLFIVLSGTEICISILWLMNTIFYESPLDIYYNCVSCQHVGMVSIFFYVFDWLVLGMTINQFKLMVLNPLDATPTKKLMHYFLLGVVFSIITAGFANLGHLTGLSVR